MHDERGQASAEWIALIALLAISLGAMARLARRDEDHALGATLAHSVTCAARQDCPKSQVVGIRGEKRTAQAVRIRGEQRTESQPPRSEAFNAPALVPNPSLTRPRPALHGPIGGRPDQPIGGRPLQPIVGRPPRPIGGRPLQPIGERPLQPIGGRPLLEWARRRLVRELGPLRPYLRGRLRAGAGRAWRNAWFACLVYERIRWAILHPESRSHEYEFPPSEAIRILNDCISPFDLVRDWPLPMTR